MTISPLNQARWARFRANSRGFWALWVFLLLFILSLLSNVVANEKPLLVSYQGHIYAPFMFNYSEVTFGGELETPADYQDPFVVGQITAHGWAVWAPIRHSFNSINFNTQQPFPAPPSMQNWLGTDSSGHDVLAQLLYGLRISLFFGILLTLFLIIMLSSVVQPNFWWLLLISVLSGWMILVGVVRAEFLRTRNFDYIRAAQAMGVSDRMIMLRHMLPNAMVATLTYMPFILGGSITTLASLDFLGFGLPIGSPSLGSLLMEGKNNLQAPWLGISTFVLLASLLSLLIFIGEAVRDAFDPASPPQTVFRKVR